MECSEQGCRQQKKHCHWFNKIICFSWGGISSVYQIDVATWHLLSSCRCLAISSWHLLNSCRISTSISTACPPTSRAFMGWRIRINRTLGFYVTSFITIVTLFNLTGFYLMPWFQTPGAFHIRLAFWLVAFFIGLPFATLTILVSLHSPHQMLSG